MCLIKQWYQTHFEVPSPTVHSPLYLCSNNYHSRSAELNIVIQCIIKGAIHTLVFRIKIWVKNSYWVTVCFTGGLLCSSTFILSHKSQKNSVKPNPSALIFSVSMRRWHIPPSHPFRLSILAQWQSKVEWRDRGNGGGEACLVCFQSKIIIKKACQTWWRWWRRPESIFRRACLSPRRGWIDRKTAWAWDFFFLLLAGLSTLFLLSLLLPFFFDNLAET